MKHSKDTLPANLWRTIRFLTAAPVFPEDEEKTRITGLMNTILWMQMVLILFFSIVGSFVHFSPQLLFIVSAVLFLIILAELFLLRRGLTKLTTISFCIFLWTIIVLFAIYGGEVRNPVLFQFIVVVLISGLLLGGWGAVIFAILSALVAVGIYYSVNDQLLPQARLLSSSASTLVVLIADYFITGVLLYLTNHNLKEAFGRVRRTLAERQRVEEALSKSNIHLAATLDALPDLMFELGSNGVIFNYHTPQPRFPYMTPHEFIGKTIYQALPKEAASIIRAALTEAVETGYHSGATYSLLMPQGPSWYELSIAAKGDHKAPDARFILLVRDVTKRKWAENALRESEIRYRAIVESTPDLICRFLPDTTLTFVNEAYCRYFGRSREQLIGIPFLTLIPNDDWTSVQNHVDMVVKSKEPVTYSHHVLALEGDVRWQQWTDSTIMDENGKVVELQSVGRDITEQKLAEISLQESERRFREMLKGVTLAGVMLDVTGRITFINDFLLSITGWSRKEVLGEDWFDRFLPPDARENLRSIFGRMMDGSQLFPHQGNEILTRLGERRLIRWNNTLLFDSKGNIAGTASIGEDITESKRMEDQLFEEKERAEITLHSIGDAVITTGIDARVQYLNPVAENLTGWKMGEAIGQPLETVFRIIEEANRQPAINPVEHCLREGRIVGFVDHTILIRRDGREFAIDDSAAPIRNRDGRIIGIVLVFHDVTEERQLSRQIAHDAMHDSLTGLVNRREFERRIERALVNSKEHHSSHMLCYLDLDQFKIVNDTAGHEAGDELLKRISRLLVGMFRQRDTFARLGGDEFGLLLENCQLDQAVIICEEIKSRIRDLLFVWEGHGFHIGVSIGVVPITPEKEGVSQLLSQADIACYTAKDLGRNRIYVYHGEEQETIQRHNEILQAARIRDVIFNDKLRLFCQPIVQVAGEERGIIHYEILLRMVDNDGLLVLPGAFIPSAERYGLMQAIDRWVIHEICLTLVNHDIDRVLVNINLSGNSLDDETLLEYVLGQLNEFSIPPDHICFEITETAAIHHLSKAQRFISTFREQGGRIALDDFGSGFSSFRYLKTLPVDFIKIDGSFVSEMLSNPGDLLMVEAIAQIAHTLGIEVIAEHVSNIETVNRLREIGVERAQGFGIGLPVPVDEIWRA